MVLFSQGHVVTGDLVGYLFLFYGLIGLVWCAVQFLVLRQMRKDGADR